jgi:hypothetical protein
MRAMIPWFRWLYVLPMRTTLAGGWLRAVFLACFLFAVAGTARAAGVDLKALKSIAIPEQPAELEKLATTLAGLVKEAYGVDLLVVKTAASGKEPAILLDRDLAIGSGMISQQELDDVKYDGYVIKAADHRIAVSGFRTRGTKYGVYALLRRIGVEFYPWNNDSAAPLKVVTPLKDTQLAEFSISDKPFFLWTPIFARPISTHSEGNSRRTHRPLSQGTRAVGCSKPASFRIGLCVRLANWTTI